MLRVSALLMLSLAAVPGVALAAGPKVGVVEVQKVMEAIPAWTKAVEALRKDFEKKKLGLESKQTELTKKKGQLDAKRTIIDPKTMAAEEQQFMAEANGFRNEYMQSQQEISAREAGLKEVMLGRIEKAVAAIGESGEYDYIVEAGAESAPNVLYAAKTAYITQATIDSYKKIFGDKAIEPPPLPKQMGPGPGGPGPGGPVMKAPPPKK